MANELVERLEFSDERALEMVLKGDNLLWALVARATLPGDPQSVLGGRRKEPKGGAGSELLAWFRFQTTASRSGACDRNAYLFQLFSLFFKNDN